MLNTANSSWAHDRESLAHVCADSTVMEMNIAHTTDSRLRLGVLEKLARRMSRMMHGLERYLQSFVECATIKVRSGSECPGGSAAKPDYEF